MAISYRRQYEAVFNEGPSGEPIEVFELHEGDPMPVRKGHIVGIHRQSATPLTEAQDIARAISRRMASFFVTGFEV
jgi:hypothetical protein